MKQYLRGDLIFSKLPVIGQQQLTLANFWNFTSKNLNISISLSESITEAGNVDEKTIQMKPFQQSFQMALLILQFLRYGH